MEGWIKIHRKILDNPIVCKDCEHYAVWNYLLLNATQKQIDAIFQGKRITLNPGQLITGRKSIAKQFNMDENKVQRILKMFEKQHQIEQQMSSQNRLITIQNWEQYQVERHQIEQQVNSSCTASEQQVNTNKNVKNDKNEKNGRSNNKASEPKIHFAEFVDMTNAEYEKLVSTHGKEFADQCIEELDNYKGANGKKYASDYRAILNWVVDKVKQKNYKPQKVQSSATEEWRKEWLKQDG